jgi:histidinol dehydrogenase
VACEDGDETLSKEKRMKLLRSRDRGFRKVLEGIARRGVSDTSLVEDTVVKILEDVRLRGDEAVVEYTRSLDGARCRPEDLPVGEKERRKAYRSVSKDDLRLIECAADRIRAFHEKQVSRSWFSTDEGGSLMGMLVTPLERVGLYVPGGKAAYPSSVLMNAIPAQVAGVRSLAICTPAPGGKLNPYVLVAADLLGIEEIYRIGGAQAVGALAYGTGTIGRVDKIVGPGNIYVATAKKIVFGEVDIDMVAGPSEILIVADESADPAHLAADLLSQAEHDEMAHCILVTDSAKTAERVRVEVERQVDTLPAAERARTALEGQGYLIVVRDLPEAFRISNAIAPEHLEVVVEDPLSRLPEIRNAGSIFLGPHTPEAVGDYLAGPNHVLPTGGTARFFSTLGVDSFIKKSNLISFSREELKRWDRDVVRFARLEGLEAHARSVIVRRKKK